VNQETPLADLVDLVARPTATRRIIIGIAGAPAAGKSTLATRLRDQLDIRDGSGTWQVLGMDGFHLSNEMLVAAGTRHQKGAPHTFDVDGFATLLNRVRTDVTRPIYLPVFHREIEESIAAEAVVSPHTLGVIVEGNYLLHDRDGWEIIRPLLDQCWYLDVDPAVQRSRLIERATQTYGSAAAGINWVETVDLPNAALVSATRSRADRVVVMDADL
jgi:pantothenate kinase